jgi:hypothetical protein
MTVCKLCNEPKDKFPKSHIIPDFMYKSLRNEKSQIFRMKMPNGIRLKSIPTGFYQKPFLCYDCEAKMNKWENYAEKVLYGTTHFHVPIVKTTDDPSIQVVEGIDYKIFKLFMLSILWRASASTHEFFSDVNLGSKHESALAKMLSEENPGEELDYPIMVAFAKGDVGKNVSIGQPYKNKSKVNAVRYVFPISEAIYVFHISSHGLEDLHRSATIKVDNTMRIVFWPVSRLQAFLELYDVKKSVSQNRRAKLFGRRPIS